MKTIRFYRLNFSCHDIPLLFRFLPIEGKRLSIGGRLDIPAIKQGTDWLYNGRNRHVYDEQAENNYIWTSTVVAKTEYFDDTELYRFD